MARLRFATLTAAALTAALATASAGTAPAKRNLRVGGRLFKAQSLRDLQETCHSALDWTSEGGEIKVNGIPYHLKGTSWFGLETQNEFPHGLWSVTRDQIFEFLKSNNFNTLRLPFSAALALTPDKLVNPNTIETELHNMTAFELIDSIIDKAGEYGIMVMLDMHRLNEDFIPELWYDDTYDMGSVKKAWDNMLTAFGDKWNVIALDLKNEPHGVATWGMGNDTTDWNTAAEDLAKHVYTNHPTYKGLVFIEGVQISNTKGHKLDGHNKWWGGDLEGVRDFPIDLGEEAYNKKIVYSPHVYGPDAFQQDYFGTKDFPENMPDIWDNQWAFAEEASGRAIVVGEWGGHYKGQDKIWQDAFADYLLDRCLEDTFYWCLNPNSGDTGGLLDYDFLTPQTDKLKLLDRVQPNPSFITLSQGGSQYCIAPGEYANSKCDRSRRLSTSASASASEEGKAVEVKKEEVMERKKKEEEGVTK